MTPYRSNLLNIPWHKFSHATQIPATRQAFTTNRKSVSTLASFITECRLYCYATKYFFRIMLVFSHNCRYFWWKVLLVWIKDLNILIILYYVRLRRKKPHVSNERIKRLLLLQLNQVIKEVNVKSSAFLLLQLSSIELVS